MDDGIILNVRARADADPIDIASQDDPEPDRAPGADFNIDGGIMGLRD